MTKLSRTVIAFISMLFAVICASVGLAQSSSVDWKYYGAAKIGGDAGHCFYDAKGIVQGADGHSRRFWTKCLRQKDLEAVDIEKDFDGKILQNTAQKVARYYVPPIASVETIDANQAMTVTQYEETANIRPHSTTYPHIL